MFQMTNEQFMTTRISLSVD